LHIILLNFRYIFDFRKLTARKACKKKMRAARKNTFSKDTTVNLVDDTSDTQNISSAGKSVCSFIERTQTSLKRKKKQAGSVNETSSDNEGSVNETSSDIQCKKRSLLSIYITLLIHFYVGNYIIILNILK